MGCGASTQPAEGSSAVVKQPTPAQSAETLEAANKEANRIVGEAIKAALKSSVQWSCSTAGTDGAFQKGGYFSASPTLNSHAITAFPPAVSTLESTLRSVPLGAFTEQCDGFVALLGQGAEAAAKACEPIFMAAVEALALDNARALYEGAPSACSTFLETTCHTKINEDCKAVVEKVLEGSTVVTAWGYLKAGYNKIPMVDPCEWDLNDWVLKRAIIGLFALIGEREAAIRADPSITSVSIVMDVFGNATVFQGKDSIRFIEEYKKITNGDARSAMAQGV